MVAVLLFVWRRLDGRIDNLRTELRTEFRIELRDSVSGLRGELNGLRDELNGLRGEMRAVSERLARFEGAAFGPWPTRSEAETAPEAESDG